MTEGPCANCGEGPLLDLGSPDAEELLLEQDRQRAERSRSLALWISLPVGMTVGAIFASVFPGVLALIPLPIPFALPIKVVVLMILVTLGSMQGITHLRRPKQWWQDLQAEASSTRDARAALRGPTKSTAIKAALFISAGALVLGLGTVITTYGELSALKEQKTVQAAFAKLSTCLLGPDTTGRGADDRIRRIDLLREATGNDPWPERCNDHAQSLYQAIEASKEHASLRSLLGTKLGCATKCDLAGHSELLSPMMTAALQGGLQWENDPDVAPPLAYEDALLPADAFPSLGKKGLNLLDHAWLDQRLVALMHEPGRAMMLCESNFADGATRFDCRSLFDGRTPVAPSSAKLLRDGTEPVLFGVTKASVKGTDDGGRNPIMPGAFRDFGSGSGSGKAKAEKPEPKRVEVEKGAYRTDGSAARVFLGEHEAATNGLLMERKNGAYRVTRVIDGQAKGSFDIPARNMVGSPWTGDDHIAWVDRKDESQTLMQQKVGISGAKNGAPTPLGPVPHDAAPTTCRSRGVHAAVVGNGEDATMTFLSENGWSSPVRAQVTDSAPRAIPRPKAMEGPASSRGGNLYEIRGPRNNPDPNAARSALRDAAEFGILGVLGQAPPADMFGSDAFSRATKTPRQGVADPPKLTCGNGAATLTSHRLTGSTVDVTQLRCTPEGCSRKRATVTFHAIKAMWMVTDLEGKVLMLWRSPLGALRSRLAPIEELANTKDIVVFDDPEFGGPKTGSLQFFSDGKTALVLFTGNGLHGLRLASDGSYGAVRGSLGAGEN